MKKPIVLKSYATWQEEMAAVEEALDKLLPTLRHPALVVKVAEKLAPVVGLYEPRVRKILLWIAKAGHPHATHDGGNVRLYGRTAVLWRWHPTPQRLIPDGLEDRLNKAGVVDTTEW